MPGVGKLSLRQLLEVAVKFLWAGVAVLVVGFMCAIAVGAFCCTVAVVSAVRVILDATVRTDFMAMQRVGG